MSFGVPHIHTMHEQHNLHYAYGAISHKGIYVFDTPDRHHQVSPDIVFARTPAAVPAVVCNTRECVFRVVR